MNLHVIVGAAATALVLSTGLALAQTPATPTAQYGQASASNAAHIGDGSGSAYLTHQQELRNMPGYTITGNGGN
jgi:hypothetical protein